MAGVLGATLAWRQWRGRAGRGPGRAGQGRGRAGQGRDGDGHDRVQGGEVIRCVERGCGRGEARGR